MSDDVKQGWDREDIGAQRKWGAQQVLAATGSEGPNVTTLMQAVDRREASGWGPDPALIEAALHLPLDQFERVEQRVKRLKLNLSPRRRR